MKLDAWTYFNLDADSRGMIDAFASPANEQSLVKNIPIGALAQARQAMRVIQQLAGRKMHVRYRGPRHDYTAATCLKQHACSFSVYWS